ncbi:MAG: c-type cytochrome [Lentisphaeraceae bacterium]|nr:c-type cytochrome [Lentisphaeraceae bacterium]
MKYVCILFLLTFHLFGQSEPKWIWDSNNSKSVVLYKNIDVNKWIHSARVFAAGDDEFTLYINGKKILSGGNGEPVFLQLDVEKDLIKDSKENLFVVKADNKEQNAGVLVELILEYYDGRPFNRISNKDWQVQKASEAWKIQDFKANAKDPRVKEIAELGKAPWEKVNRAAFEKVSGMNKPTATQPSAMKVREGFKVELLYSVPKQTQGSWVSMTVDPKGRLIVSDQYGSLYRIKLDKGKVSGIEKIELDIGHAQGLLYAFDSLYVVVSREAHGGRGLYRLFDTDGDDSFDKKVLIKKFAEIGGEHACHGIVLGPDKKSIYLISGNQPPYFEMNHSQAPKLWQEDILLERAIGKGYFKGLKTPAGWVAKINPDGTNWERIAVGFRNPYDLAFNDDGDLFTYDSDMEYDQGMPWYRPTRVCIVSSGSEFGWRHASGKWPVRWEDGSKPIHDIGPGSPTGVAFGRGGDLPEIYQKSFFICDWSFGKLYAVHMSPDGGGYNAVSEEIVSGLPLPLTDIVVNPVDKAMYFTIGGRRVQSGLYRLTWTGGKLPKVPLAKNDLRELRRELEAFHKINPAAVSKAWEYLDHHDRYIRFAARTAIEHQPVKEWSDKALNEQSVSKKIYALMALSRAGGNAGTILSSLNKIDFTTVSELHEQALVRTYAILFSRNKEISKELLSVTGKKLNAHFPTENSDIDQDLLEILVHLQVPETAEKGMALLTSSLVQEDQIAYAKSLRHLKEGWNSELRKEFFKWFGKAQNFPGGVTIAVYTGNMKKTALDNAPESEREDLQKLVASMKGKVEAYTGPPRKFVKLWSMSDFKDPVKINKAVSKPRDLKNGKQLYAAAMCISCHRFDNRGGMYGPDLTSVFGKFSPRDLLQQIIEPGLEISDQYGSTIFEKNDGSSIVGKIINLGGSTITVNTNIANPNELVVLDRRFVKSMKDNPTSMMPPGLLATLSEEDIYDLLAYLLKKGSQ